MLRAGVETTTGPLGQGLANAVVWRSPSAARCRVNSEGSGLTSPPYVFIGDGCLMEGISTKRARSPDARSVEADRFWDDNGISIDPKGSMQQWFTDEYAQAFRSLRLERDSGVAATIRTRFTRRSCAESGALAPTHLLQTVIAKGAPKKATPGRPTGRRSAPRKLQRRVKACAGGRRRSRFRAYLWRLGRARARAQLEADGTKSCDLCQRSSGAPAELQRRVSGELRRTGPRCATRSSRQSSKKARPSPPESLAEHHRSARARPPGARRRLGGSRLIEPDAVVRVEGRRAHRWR